MKKTDYYTMDKDYIRFSMSGNSYPAAQFKSIDVRIKSVLKKGVATILNATANAMTGSIGNGNEQVMIVLDVIFNEGKEEIELHKDVLIRGNLDCYEMIEHAKKLKKAMKQDILKQKEKSV